MAASPAVPPSRLRTITKLAFGAGDLGPAIVATINGFFLNAFLIEVAGIRPAAAGLIFLIIKIWDSVNDPLIGTLTDRTNTRWGRRRPWLLFGAIPFALAYFLHWLVPDLSDTGKFFYYLVVALLLDIGYTAVNVPYTALTPELTDDYDERTTLNTYRFSFSILGGTVAAFVHTIIIGSFEGPAVLRGYAISAAIWAAVIVLSNVITFAYTTERHFEERGTQGNLPSQGRGRELGGTQEGKRSEQHFGFWEGLRIAFRNRAFLYVTAIYLLSWLALQFVQNNLILYVNYWADGLDQFQWLLLALQLTTFVFLIIWNRVSQRIGKQRVYYLGTATWIAASIALFFVPRGNVTWLYLIAPIAAVGVSVVYLIPWSLLPDVIDLDELETGQRREGIYYGFFVFLQKLGISAGIAISNLILDLTGYIKPEYPGAPAVADQPAAVLTALRVFVSFVPALILLLSYVVVYYYPISRGRHAEIRAQLDHQHEHL